MTGSVGVAKTLRGTIRTLNFAPKGEIDGLLIEVDGQITQVNLPRDQAERVKGLIGQEVELGVGPEPKVAEHPQGDHPVYRLVAFAGEHNLVPTTGHQEHQPPDARHGGPTEVAGMVQRLNYAKHGEANGVVLDTGDFVHLKPDGMKRVGLQVGQQVTASGKGGPSEAGGQAIEAKVVNGVELGSAKPR